jgi:hypothetical protein
MLDVELSLAIAKYIGVKDNQCWYHALRAFFLIEDLQAGWYVEGWAIPEKAELRLPIEHGWLERNDGSIIDPAWALLGNKRVDYFPGISYTYAHAATLAKGKKSVLLPLISQRYADPFDNPAYFHAYKKSFKAATGYLPTEFDRLFMIRLRSGAFNPTKVQKRP